MHQIKRKCVIGPSILAADFAFLYKECEQMINNGAKSLHIDIMDGHFVPNLSIGAPVVSSLKKHIKDIHFDCHLMVKYPRHYVQPLSKAGANCFTFHYQSQYGDLKEICQSIRNNKMEVGLSVKPNTPIDATIQELIVQKLVDKILVMTVEPGFGGQKFMGNMMEKVKYLHGKYPALDIQVDGGIGQDNAELAGQAGANWLVAGTSLFAAQDRAKAFKQIQSKASKGLGLQL